MADKITEAMVIAVLRRGSCVSGGTTRIINQFAKNEGVKADAEFLEKEYGIGGCAPAISWADIWEEHDAKGLRLRLHKRGPQLCELDEVRLSWVEVAKRIRTLIDMGLYVKGESYRDLYNAVNSLK